MYDKLMNWVIPLLFLILFEGMADILAKEWSLYGKPVRWIGAIGAYIVANVFWLYALREGSGLTRGALIFSVGSAVLAIVIGLVLYQETLSRIEAVGVMLGIIALVLIFWNE